MGGDWRMAPLPAIADVVRSWNAWPTRVWIALVIIGNDRYPELCCLVL